MSIIERIISIAEKKGIKEVTIAKAIDKGTGQITNWKNRNTDPPAKYLYTIAKLLDVSIEFLITGAEPETPPKLEQEEHRLINFYRSADPEGRERILEQAELLSNRYPVQLTSSEYKIG